MYYIFGECTKFPKKDSQTSGPALCAGEAFGCCVPSEAVCQWAAGGSELGPLGLQTNPAHRARFLQHPQVLLTKRKVGIRDLRPTGFLGVGDSFPVSIRNLLPGVGCLFADYLVRLSPTKEGLQHLLQRLSPTWPMTVKLK